MFRGIGSLGSTSFILGGSMLLDRRCIMRWDGNSFKISAESLCQFIFWGNVSCRSSLTAKRS